jgi:hypothetical protein
MMHIETVGFGLLRRISKPLTVHAIDINLRESFVFRSSNIRIMIVEPMLDIFVRNARLKRKQGYSRQQGWDGPNVSWWGFASWYNKR